MKKIAVIIFICYCFASLHSQNNKPISLTWHTNFEEAKLIAHSQNKHILIYFTGSDRSIPCNMLNNDFFNTERFKKIADKHLVLLKIYNPRRPGIVSRFQQDKNLEISRKYKQRVHPTVVLTDADGNQIGAVESYNYLHDTSKYYLLINKAIKN